MNKEINVLALVKGEERYVFLYDDNHRTETLRMLGRYAADPDLSFNWYDAALLSQKIREIASEHTAADRVTNHRESNARPRFSFDHEDIL